MENASYTSEDVRRALQRVRHLASSAIDELDRSPEGAAATDAMRCGLRMIESAGTALDAIDPTKAWQELDHAELAMMDAFARAAASTGRTQLALDLLYETVNAIGSAGHRLRHSAGSHADLTI